MHIETYKKIINQISDKSRLIYLHMLGEPLLNNYLCDFVVIVKAHGHKVTFSTNGTLMNRKLAERLIVAGLDEIIFSVDGAKRETYEKIRIGADYNGVIKNIRDFYQMKSGTKSKCNVRIHCVISDFTRNEIDKLQYSYGNTPGSEILRDLSFMTPTRTVSGTVLHRPVMYVLQNFVTTRLWMTK